MENCSLGCTIALPGYQNIKVEVAAEGYSNTKEFLRQVLLQMCINYQTTEAIVQWWKMAFGTVIQNDYQEYKKQEPPKPLEIKKERPKKYHRSSDDGPNMADLETQNIVEDSYDGAW